MRVLRQLPVTRRRGHRRAYILLVVLGLTAVVASLGWAFLDANSTAMPEAVNWSAAMRAQYLAESGMCLGTHFLMYPPTGVSQCSFWPGASNIAIDGSSDYTNVTITRDATDPNLYSIAADGVAFGPDASAGTPRATRHIVAQVIKPSDGKWRIPYALLGYTTSTMTIPSPVHINGDIHVNRNNLLSYGWCQGKVSAVGTAQWSGTGPPTSITSNAPSFSTPTVNATMYGTYTLGGTTYAAYNYTVGSTMSTVQAAWLNSQTWSTNPGRIIRRVGNLTLTGAVQLNGTLVVTGELRFNGAGIQVTAVDGYPALVVGSDIGFESSSQSATIIGSVFCGGQIRDRDKSYVTLNVTGACVPTQGYYLQRTTGTFNLTWDCGRSSCWDFAAGSVGTPQPITILDWAEN